MIALSEEYIVQKFYEYNYNVKRNRYNNTYQGGCCICREGKSLNKKRRCFYIPKNNNIFCHNCGWSSTPFVWICKVTGKSTVEIIQDFKNSGSDLPIIEKEEEPRVIAKPDTLPKDSINLFDTSQTQFYGDNPVVRACLETIKQRKLDTAINRPDNLYVSLVDTIHKNRLIIPFVNTNKEIEFYQTRTILKDKTTKAKYISKINSEKTLFNVDKVSGKHKNVFIFEGPIDAFFVENSVAVAGITERGNNFFTPRQQHQIDTSLRFFDRIWVLDSQWLDTASLKKSEILLKAGESVFIWPEDYGTRFKDINDIVIRYNINQISTSFIEKNTYNDLTGIIKLTEIKKYNAAVN